MFEQLPIATVLLIVATCVVSIRAFRDGSLQNKLIFCPELILARKEYYRAVTSAFDRERSSGFAHTLGFWWSVASLEYYMGYVDNMAKQKTSDLRAYASKYIVGKPHITGVLIAPSDRANLRLSSDELLAGGMN